MLTPDQIERLGNSAQAIIDPVSNYLIREIARRIAEAGQLTSSAAYQLWRLQTLGKSQEQIKKRLSKMLRIAENDLQKLLETSAEVGYNYDIGSFPTSGAIPFAKNADLQNIVRAALELSHDTLHGITQTMGFIGPDGVALPVREAFNNACDFAFAQVSTGATDPVTAARQATRNLANRGIVSVDYASGIRTELGAAVRRNIMGGMGLMQEQIAQYNHDALGADGWEISAHGACAPDHEPIQGKQYTDEEYKALNDTMVRRIGTLNCGHSAHPIILGVSQPQYSPQELEDMRRANDTGITYEGRHYTTYEATQQQRALERAIRLNKRRATVATARGDSKEAAEHNSRLTALRSEYTRFSEAAGLTLQEQRTWIE